MYLRQIYCNTESTMVSKWDDTPLTACTNNPVHSVALDSESITQTARFTHRLKDNFNTNSTSFVTVTNFVFQGTNYYSNDAVPPKYLKIRSYSNVGSYNLRLLDQSNNTLWSSGTLSNNSLQVITVDFDTLTLGSTEEIFTLEAHGNSGSTCFIVDASLFSAMVSE